MKPIEFNRPKKFSKVQDLGNGACGETLLVRDEDMECEFVIKKYKPFISKQTHPDLYLSLLQRFRDEARILFRLNHKNVVRVFNYYDYKEHETAYIVMEYIKGNDIIDSLTSNPRHADRIFEGVVEGFCHLHEKEVLHRDIRRGNIIVEENGTPKIIDFGFGKSISSEATNAHDKSISLNWWCETPSEFEEQEYSFETEVYFVGKLFEIAIKELKLDDFKYKSIINKMIKYERNERISSFREVQSIMMTERFAEMKFNEQEKEIYRHFTAAIVGAVSEIDSATKFERDVDKIITKLETTHRENMLEETVVNFNKVIRIFCLGVFKFYPGRTIGVNLLNLFIQLLKTAGDEKRRIIMENLANRLEAIPRTPPHFDDHIPF